MREQIARRRAWLSQVWFGRNRAAKRCAREVAPWLRRSYGASEHYSIAQIRTAVESLRLDRRYVAIAYAAFMAREDYDALAAELPIPLAYDEARDLFLRFVRPVLRSASGEPGVDVNMVQGDGGFGHGGS